MLKTYVNIEQQMVNVERCLKLKEIPQEFDTYPKKMTSNLIKDRPHWPENGMIEFVRVSMKYRPNLETILKKLTFSVKPGEKIGVVGRTGAGKSTICLCLSRLVEIYEGSIEIDGVNIQKISIRDVRSRITVIPQDPTMFNGTLRFNLDPFNERTDQEII